MELREVIGRRRSIRFLRPYKPVERVKIQKMLEAARKYGLGFWRPGSGIVIPRPALRYRAAPGIAWPRISSNS